jgi:phosphate starvation-inducible protein PhoH
LIGKFGGCEAVERLIEEGTLILIPASDCRGLDIGSRAGVYITEAQNTTIDLMQLML